MSSFNEVFESSIDNKIYCHCVFEFKDEIKKLGFRWVPDVKKWMIPIDKFNEDIYIKSQKVRYTNNTSAGLCEYFYVYYITKFNKSDVETITNFNKNKKKEYGRKKYNEINKDVKILDDSGFINE
jgi:hypothetical protein